MSLARITEIALGMALAYIGTAALIAAAILHAARDIEHADSEHTSTSTPLADEVEAWLAGQINPPRYYHHDHQEPR